MGIGAILMLPGTKENAASPRASSAGFNNFVPVSANILGQDLVEKTVAQICNAGVPRPAITAGNASLSEWPLDAIGNDAYESLGKVAAPLLREGADTLILLRAAFYCDLDFRELLRFHGERKAAFTQVYAPGGAIELAVVDAQLLQRRSGCTQDEFVSRQECFYYQGYLNRLRKPADFAKLVEDALYGRCNLRPEGRQIASGVWFGAGAEVDPSCVVGSPSFVGKGTRIAPYCNISRGSAIEDDCHVDAGTRVDRSWILSGTYVGVGLNVRRSIVGKQRIFHLDRGTEVSISDRRLIGATRSFPLLKAAGMLRNRWQLSETAR